MDIASGLQVDAEKRAADVSTVPPCPPQPSPDEVPDGGYGWICCAALTGINGFVWGNLASFGVYLSYYISNPDLYGGSPLSYSFIGGVNFCAAMLIAPVINILMKRFGTHTPMYAGCLLWLGGWICASFAYKYYQLFLSQGLLIGLGAGLVWLPPAGVLPQWFERRRSLAQGLASSGSGIIGLIYSVATSPMIERLGIGWALRITGITSFVVLLLCTFVIRDRNRDIKADIRPFDLQLVSTKSVWLLSGYSFCVTLGYITVIYSMSAFAVSLGYTQVQAGNITAILNAGTTLGRPLIGVASDRFGRITTACALTTFNALLAFAFWIPTESYAPLVVLALIYGGSSGVFWATISPLCAEVAPLNRLASLLCLQWLTVAAPALVAQAIALEIRRDSGRIFLWPQVYTGMAYTTGALFLLTLRWSKVGLLKREKHS